MGIGVLVVVAWCLLSAVPASAEDAERISSYDVVLTVDSGGALGVTERIAYDFGTNQKHGIFRAIPTKVPFDNDNFRLYRLSDVRVTSPDGAPTDVSRSEAAGVTTLRVGDPDKTITGQLRDDADLLPYEKALFNGLFESGYTVKLSELQKKFAARLTKVQTKLYEDVTRAGWFRGRPDKVRSGWTAVGAVLTIGAGFLAFGLFKVLHWGPVAIAVLLVGLAVLFSARRMPARTARGTAVLTQALGFREYIRTAEANQLRFEEEADIFSRYLPYAVVFGEADRWVRVFGPLAAGAAVGAGVGASTGPLWYSAPDGWNSSHFSDSLTGFTSSVSSTIAASTASSSGGSGFSGGSSGGGGGGGGGGW